MRLEGKVALITGAGSGIGASCAILFAEQGAKIIASDINSNTASRVANQVRESGGKAIAVKGDVTKKTSCKRLVEQTIKYFGRLDILINSAGTNSKSNTLERSKGIRKLRESLSYTPLLLNCCVRNK